MKWFSFCLVMLAACSDSSEDASVHDMGRDMVADADFGAADTPDDFVPSDQPMDWDVAQPGPFHTGYLETATSYEPIAGTSRTITVNIWYPTTEVDGPHPRYLGLVNDQGSITGASVAPSAYETGYPVMVYSHGDQGFGSTSVRVVQYFVSHGWVVVAPDHTMNTLADNVQPRPVALYHWRTQDITQSLNLLDGIGEPEALADANLARVLLMGHSYGGLTCWPLAGATWDLEFIDEQCATTAASPPCTEADKAVFAAGSRDDRIVAAIPMAGNLSTDWFTERAYEGVTIPMFTMSGTEDQIGQQDLWDRVQGIDYTWIDVEGACHQAFALGGCPMLPTAEADAIVNTYALAFGRAHVLADSSPKVAGILSGDVEVSPKVHFQHKN